MSYHDKENPSMKEIYQQKIELKGRILEKDLRNGLIKNQFVLFYQPIIEAKTRKIEALEALIRWDHPTYGMIPPQDFIPLAEETGMIQEMGEWVLKEACEQYKAWQAAGLPSFRINVNISAAHFLHELFIEQVIEIIRKADVEPNCLEIEITEISNLKDIEKTLDVIKRLKKLGIKTALDDFGTGFNCLQLLIKIPVDSIKIDRTFVKDILDDTRVQHIVLMIINLAKDLGINFTAEGVETEEIYRFLSNTGADRMQGYLFSRPLPRNEVEDLLLSLSGFSTI